VQASCLLSGTYGRNYQANRKVGTRQCRVPTRYQSEKIGEGIGKDNPIFST